MFMRIFFFFYSNHQVVPLHRSVFSWAMYLFTLPFRLTYQTAFGVFDFVLSIFGLSGAPSRPRGTHFPDFPFMIIYMFYISQKTFVIAFYTKLISCHNFFKIIFWNLNSSIGRILTYSEVPCSLRFFRFSFHPARNFSCNKQKIPPCSFINLLSK